MTYDLAHMWTGKDMDGSVVGIAYVGAVCYARSYSYGVSQRITGSPGKFILTAHEIGHNFDASHSDQTECSNTIMNSSVGTGFTFCPFSRSEISAFVNAHVACLDTTSAAPAAPGNLSASAVSSSRINLAWQDNSTDETGFKIERKQGAGGSWSQITVIMANLTSYADTGLPANTTCFYRVRASSSAGDSAYSNEASATTSAGLPAITGFSPSSGRPGTMVTVTGTNLGSTYLVRFHGADAGGFSVVSSSQIQATVPEAATTGTISVSTTGGTATSEAIFTINRCDINGDGVANVLDIQLVINSILSIPGAPLSCDINGDGATNVLDLQVLANVVLGISGCPG